MQLDSINGFPPAKYTLNNDSPHFMMSLPAGVPRKMQSSRDIGTKRKYLAVSKRVMDFFCNSVTIHSCKLFETSNNEIMIPSILQMNLMNARSKIKS